MNSEADNVAGSSHAPRSQPGDMAFWASCINHPRRLILPWLASPLWIRIATEVLMWAGLAQSWNIIGGYTGYLCFGHGAFFGLGAYVTGIAMIHLKWPFGMG